MIEWIFGYGSLVNESTRSVTSEREFVTLNGWRREWKHIGTFAEGTFRGLTIAHDNSASIQGVMMRVADGHLEEVDRRENGYERFMLKSDVFISKKGNSLGMSFNNKCYAYKSLTQDQHESVSDYPILQSYIDVVLDGYLRNFGETGLNAFIDTTRGWNYTILNDRRKPLYPRALQIEFKILSMFDTLISERNRDGEL